MLGLRFLTHRLQMTLSKSYEIPNPAFSGRTLLALWEALCMSQKIFPAAIERT